jgi:CRISPR-associated protein Cas2
MRKVFIVSYDVCDPKRLRRVFKTMCGWGDHTQLSVFRCELNPRELVELRAALGKIIHHGEDQVMFVDVGPVEGRGPLSIGTIGKPCLYPERHALVL